jgi:hypothetical protein
MAKLDESLSTAFDIKPMVVSPEGELIVKDIDIEATDITNNEKIDSDYDSSRGNLRELLIQGKDALDHALLVAKQSEHPRAFEVVGTLIKQLADVNQQLMDVHQQKKKLEGSSKEKPKHTTNNSLFVGSTAELSKMIKDMNTGE